MPENESIVTDEEIRNREKNSTEEGMILRSQKHPESFRPLYEKYFKPIFLFVHHRVGDRDTTADITSQVFLKALSNIGQYKFRGLPFSSWLYRIALNECNDFFRKKKRYRMVSIEDDMLDVLHDELTSETRLADLRHRLPVLLEQLTADELQIIELRFFEQRPFKEVADILGITETYAKVRVYRTLDKMRKRFLGK